MVNLLIVITLILLLIIIISINTTVIIKLLLLLCIPINIVLNTSNTKPSSAYDHVPGTVRRRKAGRYMPGKS